MSDETQELNLEKYTFKYWMDELKRSKIDRETFEEIAARSINVYKKEHKLDDCERTISVWWSLVNTLIPAYFSRVPKVDVEQRKKKGADEFRLAGLTWEAATQYSIEEHFPFESVGYQSVLQFLLAGQAIIWARYEANLEPKEYEFALDKSEDEEGSYIDGEGKKYEGEGEISEREGRIYAKETVDTKTGEKAVLECINYKDYRSSCSRNDEEVTWKAKRCYLTRAKAEEMFGDKAKIFNYNSYPEEKDKDRKEKHDYEGCAQVWEIWCKESNKVYHIHNGGKEKFIEDSEIPVDYNGFWPCIDIKANIEPNSVVPFSDYHETEDMILEVERLTTRIHATLQAIRANFAYNKQFGDDFEKLLEGDLRGIPVNMSATQTRISDGVWFNDITPYIKSLEVLITSREQALGKLYETTAASDLIRGSTAPLKTATANMLESNFTNLRFSVRREQVARFLTAGIKKVGEIIVQKFDDQTIYDMSFGEEIAGEIPDPPQPPPPPQIPPGQPPVPPMPPIQIPPIEKFKLILGVLRDNTMRNFKLDIESDSIVELDQRADRAERIDAMTSAGAFLQQLEPMIKLAPASAQFAKGMMRFVLRSYKAGKEIEGDLMNALDAMIQQISQASQQGENEKDNKAQDNAAKVQVAQIKAQSDSQKVQADLQKTKMNAISSQQESNIDMQIAMMDARNKQLEYQVKYLQLKLSSDEMALSSKQAEDENVNRALEIQQSRIDTQAGLIKEQMDTEQEQIKALARPMQSGGNANAQSKF